MQLQLNGLITEKEADEQISLICSYLNLKFASKYKLRGRFAWFQRWLYGVEVERSILIVYEEDFESLLSSKYTKFVINPLDIRSKQQNKDPTS